MAVASVDHRWMASLITAWFSRSQGSRPARGTPRRRRRGMVNGGVDLESDDRRERAQPSTSEEKASLLRGPCALCSHCHRRPATQRPFPCPCDLLLLEGWLVQRNAFCGCCVSCALLAACRWRRCAAGGEDSARDQGELRGISEQRHTAMVLPERAARSWRRARRAVRPLGAGHPQGCPPSSSTCIQPSSPTRRTRRLDLSRALSSSLHGKA